MITSSARFLLRKLGLIGVARRLWCEVASRRKGIELHFAGDKIYIRRGSEQIVIGRAHEVYLNDMIAFFDYYFSAVTPEAEQSYATVTYSAPRLHRLRRSQVEFEFPALPESDESTEMYLHALQLKEGDVVLDLGAYSGASTYFFAKAVGPDGVVAAFEPDATSRRYLDANIRRHRLTNVKVFDRGIWRENTTLAFQAEGNMGSSVSAILKRETNVHSIPVVTLEEAAKMAADRPVTAIKMDIEGAELEVLQSARHFLKQHRPAMVIEPHNVNGRMNTQDVCSLLRDIGYRVQVLSQGSQEWPLIAASAT